MIRRRSEPAYQQLKAEILDWHLLPGTRLEATALADRLGVPIHEIEEALGRLIHAGLVDAHEAGISVAGFDTENVVELFELREALEVQVARLAARRHDPARFQSLRAEIVDVLYRERARDDADVEAFYGIVDRLDAAIDDAVANPFLISSLAPLRAHLLRARRVNQARERIQRALAEQLVIVDAILEHDEVLAMQATAVHLRASLVNLLERIGVSGSWTPR